MINPAPGARIRITVGAGAKYSTSRHRINNAICSSFCNRVLDTTDVVRGGNLKAGHVPCVGQALLVADAAEGGLEETCLPPPVAPAPAVQSKPHSGHVLPELNVRTCSWLRRSLELHPSSSTCILCGGHMAGQMLPTSFQDLRAYLSDSPA